VRFAIYALGYSMLTHFAAPATVLVNLSEAMSATPRDYSSVSDSIVINVESKQNALEAVMPTASPQQYTPYTGRMDRRLEVNKKYHLDFESRYTDSEFLKMDEAFCYAGSLHALSPERYRGLPHDIAPDFSTYLVDSSPSYHSWDKFYPSSLTEGYLDLPTRSITASGNAWAMYDLSCEASLSNYDAVDMPVFEIQAPATSEAMYMHTKYGASPTATGYHRHDTGRERSIAPSVDSGYDSLSNNSTPIVPVSPRSRHGSQLSRHDVNLTKKRRLNAVSGAGYAVLSSTTNAISRDTQQQHSSNEDNPWRTLNIRGVVQREDQNTDRLTITSETFPGRQNMLGDHLAITTQQTSLEKFPDTIKDLDLKVGSNDKKEDAPIILDVYPYRHAQTDVAHVSNHPEKMTTTEADTEECDDNGLESSDDPKGIYAYSSALRYFGLLASPRQSKSPEIQDSHDGVYGTSSTSGSMSSISSYINSLGSFGSVSSSIADTNSSNCGKRSSDGGIVAMSHRTGEVPSQNPLELLCWHAAIGLKCNGATGRNKLARRLYS
jgi:hypothetical protein